MQQEKLLPLKGVRVVELSTYIAVASATRMMAEWGAEVIKVENFSGDEFRQYGRVVGTPITEEENPAFFNVNMNKQMVALDLGRPEGHEALMKLLENADVFATNVRSRSLRKLGLAYEDLKDRFPKLVYADFTGYGPLGPSADVPGYDFTAFWARGGVVNWVDDGDYPPRPSSGFGDMTSSAFVAFSIMAALFGRATTGKAVHVSNSLYANSLWCGSIHMIAAQYGYRPGKPDEKNHPNNPLSSYSRTKDGHWVVTTVPVYERGFEKVCRALGLEQFIGDERYSTLARVREEENIRVFLPALRARVAEMTIDEVDARLTEYDISHERLYRAQDHAHSEQAWANNYLRKVEFGNDGTAVLPTVPIQFEGFDSVDWQYPGAVGSNTEAVLLNHGYSQQDIQKLREAGAIK